MRHSPWLRTGWSILDRRPKLEDFLQVVSELRRLLWYDQLLHISKVAGFIKYIVSYVSWSILINYQQSLVIE